MRGIRFDVYSLKQDAQGVMEQNKNHNHYFQVLTQLAVTGSDWCNFFVWCPASSCHYETIWFDRDKVGLVNVLPLSLPCYYCVKMDQVINEHQEYIYHLRCIVSK